VLQEVHQHIATEGVGRGVEGPPSVESGDLLDKGVLRALEVEGDMLIMMPALVQRTTSAMVRRKVSATGGS